MKRVIISLGLLLITSASFAYGKGGFVVGRKNIDRPSEQPKISRLNEQGGGESIVRWKRIVGVITSPDDATTPEVNEGANSPVGNINSGTFPWSARGGRAQVDLSNGHTSFDVEGLVIVGNPVSGTPGPISAVTGTLVCNAGSQTQATFDTAPVSLSPQGDASFSGQIENVPATCDNPIFLIRIATPVQAAGLWIATGAERSFNNKEQ